MAQGIIKKLITDKGYGFINGEKKDVFFHRREVKGVRFESLKVGQLVNYELVDTIKGLKGINVRVG